MNVLLRRRLNIFKGLCALSIGVQSADAIEIATYDFEGDSFASVDMDALSTASNLSLGAGLTAENAFVDGDTGRALRQHNGTHGAVDIVGNDLTASLAGNDYYTFNVTATSTSLSFDTLSFDHFISGAFSLARFHVLVDADEDGWDTGDELAAYALVNDTWTNASLNISSLAPLALGESLEFRIYLTDSGMASFKPMTIDNLNVSAVPEPQTCALLFGGLGLAYACVRRRA